ncbi:hypothetical protein BVY02_02205 [bacterium J17]|nr:hypothetical protein BVY02_02205 [bacterium J17]
MSISLEAQRLIDEEVRIFNSVLDSLRQEKLELTPRMLRQEDEARGLTETYLSLQQDGDRQLMASDVAVSRKLAKMKNDDSDKIDKLIEKPYFARIIVRETQPDGQEKDIEYKIGLNSNINCRIIDWKKAPISKLYYEYQEGDEFFEVIQGREREGRIVLRNKLRIENGKLIGVSCSEGDFVLEDNGWKALGSGTSNRSASSYGKLPDVLSLISKEQFQAITEEATSAVLIQGTAGSGKTTVALYRLAWILEELKETSTANDVIIVVRGKVLSSYIKQSLSLLDLENVRVVTYQDWSKETLSKIVEEETGQKSLQESSRPHRSTIRVKKSLAILKAIDQFLRNNPGISAKPLEILISVLADWQSIVENDETGFIDKEVVDGAYRWTVENQRRDVYDRTDQALLSYIYEAINGAPIRKDGSKKHYHHVIVDEVQDFSPTELASIVKSVKKVKHLTLVGDSAQAIDSSGTFLGWDKLRAHWNIEDDLSRFISLTVSHRSTLQIMRLADYVRGEKRTTEGRQGKPPIWFSCEDENTGITETIQWIERVSEKFPGTLICVICPNPAVAREALSYLDPTFGSAVRLGDEDSFTFEEGILVTDVRNAKGLEFPHVMIWNPSKESYPKKNWAKNRLYVGMTRAEDHLCLVTWERHSPLLPSIHSKLVRGIEKP